MALQYELELIGKPYKPYLFNNQVLNMSKVADLFVAEVVEKTNLDKPFRRLSMAPGNLGKRVVFKPTLPAILLNR